MSIWEVMPALVALCVSAGVYIWVCIRFPPAIMLSVVAYSMIFKLASTTYIETVDVYLIEVGMTSYIVGATLLQIVHSLLIFVIALAIIGWTIKWMRPEIALRMASFGTPECNRELHLTLIISAALLCVQILNAILSPPYPLPGSGITRHDFWPNIRFPLIEETIGVLVFFVPAIAGVALAYGRVTNQRYFRRFSVILITAYGIYFLLTGVRFNGSVVALLMWLSSYWIVLWAFGVKLALKRVSLWGTLILCAFLAGSYSEVAERGISQMTGSTLHGILYRVFALQGNVSFAAYALANEGESRPTTLLLGDMTTTVATYMPADLGDSYLDHGVNLVGSLPGSSVLVFGHWLGLVPMAIYAVLLGLITSLYIFIVLSGRFLLVLPGAYLCLWIFTAEVQGNFAFLLGYKFYLFLWLIIIGLLIARITQQNKSPIRAHTARSTKARS